MIFAHFYSYSYFTIFLKSGQRKLSTGASQKNKSSLSTELVLIFFIFTSRLLPAALLELLARTTGTWIIATKFFFIYNG